MLSCVWFGFVFWHSVRQPVFDPSVTLYFFPFCIGVEVFGPNRLHVYAQWSRWRLCQPLRSQDRWRTDENDCSNATRFHLSPLRMKRQVGGQSAYIWEEEESAWPSIIICLSLCLSISIAICINKSLSVCLFASICFLVYGHNICIIVTPWYLLVTQLVSSGFCIALNLSNISFFVVLTNKQ